MNIKNFTVEEANRLLPQVEDWLKQLDLRQEELESTRQALGDIEDKIAGNGGNKKGAPVVAAQFKFNETVQKLHDIGCVLKNIDVGLLDFPALKDGRQIWLCWKRGEKEIKFWHEMDSGFSGRQPIEDL